jgi:hypothetical protein
MAGATNLVDALGTPIAVGAQVRFTGLVTSVAPTDTHYGEVSVTPTYPVVPKVNMGILNDIANGIPQATVNANPVNISPGMLVVGIGTGGGGMSQTPWVTDIDGGNKNLYNVASIATGPVTVTGDVNITGAFRVNGVILPGQTPWLQNVNAGNFTLTNVASISSGPVAVTGNVNVTGNYLVNGVPIPGQTPWQQNVNGNGFALSGVSTVAATGNITASNVNVTGNFQVNGVNIPTALTPWISDVSAAGFRLLNLAPALGVGVTSPAYAVDVLGDINCSGTLRVKGISIAAGGGVQTPWMQDITANSHQLIGVGTITSSVTGATLAFGTQSSTASITGAGDAVFNSGTFGNTSTPGQVILSPNHAAIAEWPAGVWIEATGTGSIIFRAGNPGTTVIGYEDGNSQWSALEIASNSSGLKGPLKLMKSGGNVTVGASVSINGVSVTAPGFVSSATGAALAFSTPANAATITGAGDATFNSVYIFAASPGTGVHINPVYQNNAHTLNFISAGSNLAVCVVPGAGGLANLAVCNLSDSLNSDEVFITATGNQMILGVRRIGAPATLVSDVFVGGWSGSSVNIIHFTTGSGVDAATINSAGTIVSNASGAALAFTTRTNTATITGAGDANFNSVTASGAVTAYSFVAKATSANLAFATPSNTAMITGNGVATFAQLYVGSPGAQILFQMVDTASLKMSPVEASLAYQLWLNPSAAAVGGTKILLGNEQSTVTSAVLQVWNGGSTAGLFASSGSTATTPITRLQIGDWTSYVTGIDFLFNNVVAASILPAGTFSSAAAGAALAFATPSNAAVITGAGDASFNTITAPGLPSVAPAAGSKKFWYDPADSNRVKFAA